jgi:hypothetical protein
MGNILIYTELRQNHYSGKHSIKRHLKGDKVNHYDPTKRQVNYDCFEQKY